MHQALLEFIKVLTTQDKKTLSQKTLKAVEEVGELAKKVLPFENAPATTHRFVQKQDILEECADLMLCALSIAYDLGFDDEALTSMMEAKSAKWANLQAREVGVKYPLPFEIHITVSEAEKATFLAACAALGVKPILLALQNRQGVAVLHEVMTSSTHFGDNRSALEECIRIAEGLQAAGLTVVRRKIETVPWHPAAPALANGVGLMPPGGYFESHLNVLLDASVAPTLQARVQQLSEIAQLHSAHLSQNQFKQVSDSTVTRMMTLRAYDGTRESFEAHRDRLVTALREAGFLMEKVITEFSLFDSARNHDASWLSA